MKLAIGNSRMDKVWRNCEWTWEEFCERVSITTRTPETIDEYRSNRRGQQDRIKDVGGFVGGWLREGRRKNGNVLCRSMLTLDMDYAEPGVWDDLCMTSGFCCCLYSTHKHTSEKPRSRRFPTLSSQEEQGMTSPRGLTDRRPSQAAQFLLPRPRATGL